MDAPARRENPRLFALNDEGAAYRSQTRAYLMPLLWLALTSITVIFFIFLAEGNLQRFAILGLSLLKYIPLLFVVYGLARQKAAAYLADIYELEDLSVADNFIEEVAFGGAAQEITIREGRISQEDERSPLILIGGPGKALVHLDSIAVLERVDGAPEIIEPRKEPWKFGVFERIREISQSDEPGKREYAIVNLRDQFARNLPIRTRTKDGIPIEARDIKVMFSILRKPPETAPANNPYHYEESAAYALVYENPVMTAPAHKPAGISFPWDTVVIPLVIGELETLIQSRNLSEILASISQKEIETLAEDQQKNSRMRLEMTGEQTAVNRPRAAALPRFESRSQITAKFFGGEFIEKAARLGVVVHWIDIGTWQVPSEAIGEELKSAWKLNRDNAARRQGLERANARLETNALVDMVQNVVIGNYFKTSGTKLSDKEYLELLKSYENNPDVMFSKPGLRERPTGARRDPHAIALDILKAFRQELLAGRDLIEKESRSSTEKQDEIAKIDKALKDIEQSSYHMVKGS